MPYKDKEKQRQAQREYARRMYREKYAPARQRTRRERNEYIRDRKKVPCIDCDGRFPVICMDFDHVRGDKVQNLCAMANNCRPLDIIDLEIAKCDIVCANCHRIRTAARGQWLGLEE